MINNSPPSKLILWLSMVAIFAFPALNNVHYDPQPQFWAEISVAWGVIITFLLILFKTERVSIPAIAIPLTLFALYLVVQPQLLTVEFPGLNYVTALEMLICILLAISINSLKEMYGLPTFVRYLCYALLVGGILQSCIGFIQYTGANTYFGDLIFYDSAHPTSNIFGHFGQRNHYAHYLSWVTFATIYLFQQRKIPSWLFNVLLIWLCFSITIAASRSVFIYFGAAIIICGIYQLIRRDHDSRHLLLLIISASAALFAIEYFYPLIHKLFTVHNNFSSGLERFDSDSGTGRRGIEWAKAWLVFKTNPILGFGWNEYAKQSVLLYHFFPNTPVNSGLFTNCHNLILQLLAETGLCGTLIVMGGIIWSLIRIIRHNLGIDSVILMLMLATTLAHSMDEYPLWYMYFLAGLVCFLAIDPPLARISAKISFKLAILPLALLMFLMIRGSITFDNLVNYTDAPDEQKAFNQQAKYLQDLVDHNVLWSYFASYTLDNYINLDNDYTDDLYSLETQYAYTHRLDSFHPYPDTLIKEGMLAWNLGHPEQARQLVNLAILAFPVYADSYRDTLKLKKYRPLRNLVPLSKK